MLDHILLLLEKLNLRKLLALSPHQLVVLSFLRIHSEPIVSTALLMEETLHVPIMCNHLMVDRASSYKILQHRGKNISFSIMTDLAPLI